MTYRSIALFSIRHRWRIVGCWLALAGLCSWFAAHLPDVLGDHGLVTKGQYAEVQKRLSREFHMPDEPVILLFHRGSDVRREEFHDDLRNFLARVERIDGVDVAASPLKRKGMVKGNAAYALVSLDGSLPERRQEIEEIRREITVSHPMKIRMAGKPVVQEDVNRSSKRDMKAAESVGLPVAFALLAWTFGGVGAALIPLLAGGLSVLIAMGIMYGIGVMGLLSLSVFVHNVIPMAGMAVSIDFALLMVSRYREERRVLRASEAVVRTVTTSGRAVATSVLCVIMALAGTLAIRMPIFQSVALAAIVVLLVSAFVNMTLVPALLYLFDVRITARQTLSRSEAHRGWDALIRGVLGRPFFGMLLSLIVLTLMLIPMRSLNLDIPGPDSLPQGTDSREAAATFDALFKPPGGSHAFLLVDQKADPSGEAGRG